MCERALNDYEKKTVDKSIIKYIKKRKKSKFNSSKVNQKEDSK